MFLMCFWNVEIQEQFKAITQGRDKHSKEGQYTIATVHTSYVPCTGALACEAQL
jgi:hypothetical protein